jgi:hypothetical protein
MGELLRYVHSLHFTLLFHLLTVTILNISDHASKQENTLSQGTRLHWKVFIYAAIIHFLELGKCFQCVIFQNDYPFSSAVILEPFHSCTEFQQLRHRGPSLQIIYCQYHSTGPCWIKFNSLNESKESEAFTNIQG